ncbi:MAG: hypothetical protein BWY63_02382 [Chloroflexi bacterium ADurb.Bin360]|nr:MAG: hypothetical protein BWY63_02382 [Chloroflexi bacterium ADurb.Bin360]
MSTSIVDQGSHKGGVLPVTQRGGGVKREGCVFLHGHRFAGQCGFLDAQVDGFDEAHIRRNEIAGFQVNDIAGHQLAGGYRYTLPIAQYLAFRRRHLLQCGEGFLGFALLDYTEHGV